MNIKNGYPTHEQTSSGWTHTTVWYGSMEEMESLQLNYPLGAIAGNGRITYNSLKPSGGFWELEVRAETTNDGDAVEEPPNTYGKKSAQIHGAVMAMPLEAHEDYRTNWNHYLFADPDTDAVPSWWSSASDAVLDSEQAKKYEWGKALSDRPVVEGKKWHVIKEPQMPGVQTYDLAVVTMTEGARYRSFRAALTDMGERLNRLVSPFTRYTVSDGRNWKCDDMTISWTGKFWIGNYSYTLSGPGGWNKKLYK